MPLLWIASEPQARNGTNIWPTNIWTAQSPYGFCRVEYEGLRDGRAWVARVGLTEESVGTASGEFLNLREAQQSAEEMLLNLNALANRAEERFLSRCHVLLHRSRMTMEGASINA